MGQTFSSSDTSDTATTPYTLTLKDGRKLEYAFYGDTENSKPGCTILYQHGVMSSHKEAAILDEPARALGIRLLAFNRSGYGGSSPDPNRTPESAVEDAEELLNAVIGSEEKVAVMGVSGGSIYAAACAARLGKRISGLILNVPQFPPTGQPELLEHISEGTKRVLNDVGYHPLKAKVILNTVRLIQRIPHGNLILRYGGFGKTDLETVQRFPKAAAALKEAGKMGTQNGIDGNYRDLYLMATEAVPEGMLESIHVSVVHVWAGALDITTPAQMGEMYAKAIPGARLTVVDGYGHFLGFGEGMRLLKEFKEAGGVCAGIMNGWDCKK